MRGVGGSGVAVFFFLCVQKKKRSPKKRDRGFLDHASGENKSEARSGVVLPVSLGVVVSILLYLIVLWWRCGAVGGDVINHCLFQYGVDFIAASRYHRAKFGE